MDPQDRTVEEKIAEIAALQHGVVARRQLLAEGVSPEELKLRIRKGGLLREHRGVFRVGHRAPSVEARYMAAVLAAGEAAVLCGRAAAYLWGLVKGEPPPPEVLTPSERRVERVRTRRSRSLDARDVAVCRDIPLTSVARTLVDLAAEMPEEALARACHEAGVRHGLTPRAVREVLGRRPTSPGARKLRRIMEGRVQVTLSKLEAVFSNLMATNGLPLPVMNRPAGGYRVDCRWPDYGLTVELDSFRFHNSRHSWEADRRREREARARGDDFRRYTYGDVLEHPAAMMRELHAFFAAKRPG